MSKGCECIDMALNRIKKQMIDPDFVKQVDDNTTQLEEIAR